MTAGRRRARRLRGGKLWHNRDFRRLWIGQTTSQVGSRITDLALPLTGLLVLDASPQQLGILHAAEFAPVLLVTLLAGVWADRYRRRPILVTANLGRALVLALVPITAAVGSLSMPLLYAVALVAGAFTALFEVTYLAYLPSLVDRADLLEANAKSQSSQSVAQLGGHGAGGVLVQLVTGPGAVLVDAVSYLAAAVSLLAIRRPEHRPARAGRRGRGVVREAVEGLRLTLADPVLRPLALQSGWFNMLNAAVLVILPTYAVRSLHLQPATLGAVLASGSLGAVAGAMSAAWAARRYGTGRAMALGMAAACGSYVLLPLVGGTPAAVVAMLIAAFALFGAGLALFNVHSVSIRQRMVPSEALGRVTASYRLISAALIPVGGFAGGVAAGVVGVRTALSAAAVGLVLSAAVFAASSATRTQPGPRELLMIGVGRMGLPYVAAARRLAVPVRAVEYDGRADAIAGLLDEVHRARGGFDELIAEAAYGAVARRRPGAVVAFSEEHVMGAALLQDALGLPGPSLHASVLSRNKALQRGRFAACGLPQPDYVVTRDLHEARVWASTRFPVVVKPLSSGGSAGVELVPNLAAYADTAQRRAGEGRLLVETAVQGPEFSWEGLIREGRVWFSNVTAKETTGPPHFVEVVHRAAADLDPAATAQVQALAAGVIGALRFRTGLMHLEFRMSATGPKIMEVAVRTPGDFIMDIIGLAWDLDWFELTLRLALDLPMPQPPPSGPRHYTASYLLTAEPGRVTAVEGLAEVLAHPGVVRAEVKVGLGDVVGPLRSSAGRVGGAIIRASTRRDLEATLDFVRSTLRVHTHSTSASRLLSDRGLW